MQLHIGKLAWQHELSPVNCLPSLRSIHYHAPNWHLGCAKCANPTFAATLKFRCLIKCSSWTRMLSKSLLHFGFTTSLLHSASNWSCISWCRRCSLNRCKEKQPQELCMIVDSKVMLVHAHKSAYITHIHVRTHTHKHACAHTHTHARPRARLNGYNSIEASRLGVQGWTQELTRKWEKHRISMSSAKCPSTNLQVLLLRDIAGKSCQALFPLLSKLFILQVVTFFKRRQLHLVLVCQGTQTPHLLFHLYKAVKQIFPWITSFPSG